MIDPGSRVVRVKACILYISGLLQTPAQALGTV
ncbi:hypothetical protein SMB34_16025 [Thalassospira permensis NBRC 106175]|uniref:Uncharacterized protein n=1 Tax=Thalassospira permensis NBRC 106175 TaxID=1353532 RepID=A0ABR4TR17_9PROT|nr:hypothetical protein SMB34_16025 [Thalassospira permensis NBRC 106175]